AERLSRGSLEALCRAEIPAVRVDGLLDGAECDAVMRALPGGGFERYAPHPAFQTFERIGIAQGGYGSSRRDDYFEAAVAARAERDAILRASGVDPLSRAMERLRTDGGADVSIARNFHPAFASTTARRAKAATFEECGQRARCVLRWPAQATFRLVPGTVALVASPRWESLQRVAQRRNDGYHFIVHSAHDRPTL
ncbi:MAG: hypothetical protein ACOYN3_10510, partial [Acidimicrobiia bacterium]